METKKENSKNLPKNDDGTDLRRLPLGSVTWAGVGGLFSKGIGS